MKKTKIKTKREYQEALKLFKKLLIFDSKISYHNIDQGKKLSLQINDLFNQIKNYENNFFSRLKLPDPIDAIKFRMEQQNLKSPDLVRAGCGDKALVSRILNRKRRLSLRFIRAFHKICDATPLEVLIQEYKL